MSTRRRSITFFALVAFCLTQVIWWCYYSVRLADQIGDAAQALTRQDLEAVPRAFEAESVEDLTKRAGKQHRMFVLEGITFSALILVAASLFWAALRREDTMRREQDRFLAGATHELKTPLATLRLGLESMGDTRISDDRRRAYLDGLLPEVDRLAMGIDNVLCAAGLRTARPSMQRVVGDLRSDVESAIAAVRAPSAAARVRIALEAPQACPVARDPTSMRIVLHNLLDNAIKYSEADSVCTVRLAPNDGMARLEVIDQGRGMSELELQRAFDPFWRGRDDHVGGAGLGLHLVRELVQAQGGRVAAHSTGDGTGSTFVVDIPLSDEAS